MGPYGGVNTYMCFPPPLCGSPANHLYVITCGTGKKNSKMAGNSTSKPLNSTPNELSANGGELHGRGSMDSRDTK